MRPDGGAVCRHRVYQPCCSNRVSRRRHEMQAALARYTLGFHPLFPSGIVQLLYKTHYSHVFPEVNQRGRSGGAAARRSSIAPEPATLNTPDALDSNMHHNLVAGSDTVRCSADTAPQEMEGLLPLGMFWAYAFMAECHLDRTGVACYRCLGA